MRHRQPGFARWTFIWVALIGVAILGGLVLVTLAPSVGRREGPEPTRTGPKVLGGLSSARLMDRRTRAEEARRLGQTRTPEAVPLLRKFTDDTDPEVRLACVWALGQIGDPDALPAIRVAVHDDDARVRIEAAKTLGRLGPRTPDPGLRELLADADPHVRLAVVEVLAEMLPDPKATDWVRETIGDEDVAVRLAATNALTRPASADTEGLVRALASEDAAVRARAAEALEPRGQAVLEPIRQAINPKMGLAVRKDILALLARIGGLDAAPVAFRLVDDRRPRAKLDPELRAGVTDFLASLGEPVLETLRQGAIEGECGLVAEEVADDVCRRLGQPAATPIIQTILAWKLFPDPEELKRWVAVLGEVGDASAAPAFSRALAQDIEGMEAAVAAARQRIEARLGAALPPAVPDAGILADQPGPEAWRPVRPGTPFLTPAALDASALPADGLVRLRLERAIVHPKSGGTQALDLELVRQGGRWIETIEGFTPFLNKRDASARLTEHREADGAVDLTVRVAIGDDSWVNGGFGEYAIRLARGQKGWTGTHQGTYNARDVAGDVSVLAYARPAGTATVTPAARGEYPRAYFRRPALPVLREKARTPFGRAVVRAIRRRVAASKHLYAEPVNYVTTWQPGMDAAIGHAFLALMFDDPPHGRRAAALILDRTTTEPYIGEHGERLPEPAFHYPFAYDLGYEFCTPKERETISGNLGTLYNRVTWEYGAKAIFAVSRGVFAIPGLMGVLTYHDAGPLNLSPPEKPPPVTVVAPEDPAPPQEAVPVNRFRPGTMIAEWLAAGPFPAEGEADPLEALGGRAGARPKAGDAVTVGRRTVRFEPLAPDAAGQVMGMRGNGYLAMPGKASADRWFLYALLAVERDQGCLADVPSEMGRRWSRAWLNGREIRDGEVLLLKAGLYRMLVEVKGPGASPGFAPLDAHFLIGKARRHEALQADYETFRRRHDATGDRQDVILFTQMLLRGARLAAWQETEAARDQGAVKAGAWTLPFLAAAWTALGEPGGRRDIPMILAVRPDLAGSPDLRGRYLCWAMGLAPDGLRGTLAAEFRRRYLPDNLPKLGCVDLVAAFVNYPLDEPPPAAP